MNTNELLELEKDVQSLHQYLQKLSLEERRAAIIQMRDSQTKTARYSAIGLLLFGLAFLAGTLFFWQNQFHMSVISTLGILGGVVVAVIGFKYILSARANTYSKILANDFSDEDILAWFKEQEEVNRRFVKQWSHRGKYLFSLLAGDWLVLFFVRVTQGFAIMLLFSGMTI